ncbi:glycoside hydrolase domain-containing protein [Aquihabitans daechungensis]|uniref:glycoside hydrolase domain-containing protein n=1 Tax=Aquihabitans daechungensis TaxID=1052257 RepID=UPI003BA06EFF
MLTIGAAGTAAAAPPPSAATTQDGFDTCQTPSAAAMRAWASDSVYTAVGVYVGGVNRGCAHPELTRAWVSSQLAAGWSIMPLYMGRQAPCTSQAWAKISPGSAMSQGVAAGRDAVEQMQALGMGPGSPVYLDVEGYTPRPGCHEVVFRYIDGWTEELHRRGYRSGVYGSALSPIDALADHYPPGADPRPDDLWIARWNGVRNDEEELLDPSLWADRRIHQYRGGHDETHGGVTIRVDSNFVNGSVVRRLTVAPGSAHAPFASWEGLVAQQQADFEGRTWNLQDRTSAVAQLAAGRITPDGLIEWQLRGPWFEPHVAPVARLYRAYFGRTPDIAGSRYWAERHRRGTRLATISQHFASSSEFQTKTGGLDDEAFVRRLYTDVLGRPPDADGLRFWTARLRSKASTRGEVMVQFSESTEHRRSTAVAVDTFLAFAGMLQRAPRTAELDAATPLRSLIPQIRSSPEYAARVQ